MGNSRSLFRLFLVFSNINTILTQQINVTNDPSSMQHWDSNSQPLWHESPSLTTRPGLPPQLTFLKACCFIFLLVSRLKTSVRFVPLAASPAASVGKFKNFFVRGRKNGQRLFIHFGKIIFFQKTFFVPGWSELPQGLTHFYKNFSVGHVDWKLGIQLIM